MKIIRATHLGMCFGVRDAIELAKETAARTPVTVLGQLAHNSNVVEDLERAGIRTVNGAEHAATKTVVITAHGISEKRRNALEAAGHDLVDATCPLVQQAHRELRMLLMAGYYPVLIGKRDHVEVVGLTEDLTTFHVVEGPADIDELPDMPKLGVVAQTTQPIDRVRTLVTAIRERFPKSDVTYMDTVCRPTKDRQIAAVELAQRSSVVVVVGGANSNNTHELVQTCRRHCDRVYHVENATRLRAEWIRPDDIVGITAGTSTPDATISGVEERLEMLARTHETLSIAP